MRIGCLQFAPQVGEVDNNLNRADAILARADQDDVDGLDLLVLPELAFSGNDFKSYNDIAPYLEPSGSGISSLWARTIALKHNTNVLVGYPEQLEKSPEARAGPEYYNSAILVNGEGETVANYRQNFLHSADETWASEGEEFFSDRVPGLGNAVIGIGSDIDPYRLAAPWHAFEFAFHILDVRANLAIVSMAWCTKEDCQQFTQFPNEPDMDILTYWAQRLEPIIRDESRDELVIVFCNRTGIENMGKVYAGTSSVIGIHQGEVKVYGILGRGVKQLLVVDTDMPPFANLTMRKEKTHLSRLEKELRSNAPMESDQDTLLKPSSAHRDVRTATRDAEAGNNSQTCSDTRMKRTFHSAIAISTPPETATAPKSNLVNPTSHSSQQVSVEFRRETEGEDDEIYSTGESSDSEGKIMGGSVDIFFEDDLEEHDSQDTAGPEPQEAPSARAFASPRPPPDHSLPYGSLPARFHQKPTIYMQYPNSAEPSSSDERSDESEHSPSLSDHSVKSEGECESRVLPELRSKVPTRPSTATGVRPSRPSSPKSRNLSRNGRIQQDAFEVLDPDTGSPGQGVLHRRAQSVTAQAREYDNRSPNPRSISRPGRVAGLDQGLIERALDFYLGSMSIDARDRAFAARNDADRSRSHDTNKDTAGANSTELSSLNGLASSSDSRSTSATSDTARSQTGTPNSDKGTEKSRTVLWKEDSQIAGPDQQTKLSSSSDENRGRRRSRSATSTNTRRSSVRSPRAESTGLSHGQHPGGRAQTRSLSRPQPGMDQRGRWISTSQFGPRNGNMIRTIRDPSLGPPVDPDDEIIAEITFRRPCQNCGNPNCGSKRSFSVGPSPQPVHSQPSEHAVKQRQTSESSIPSADEDEKTPTFNKHKAATPGLARLVLQTSAEELDDLRAPNLSRTSLRTLGSYEPSPVTPPPRRFEPRMSKAMVFSPDTGRISQTPADSALKLKYDAVDALLDEMISLNESKLPVALL